MAACLTLRTYIMKQKKTATNDLTQSGNMRGLPTQWSRTNSWVKPEWCARRVGVDRRQPVSTTSCEPRVEVTNQNKDMRNNPYPDDDIGRHIVRRWQGVHDKYNPRLWFCCHLTGAKYILFRWSPNFNIKSLKFTFSNQDYSFTLWVLISWPQTNLRQISRT